MPSARLASDACADMDILAGFEAAIHDGVDVLSISIGGGDPNYVHDSRNWSISCHEERHNHCGLISWK